MTSLAEFVEAPSVFIPPAPDTLTVSNERFTLRASIGGTWLGVQRIRLQPKEVDDAVDAARSFMRVAGASHASWWICEHSQPPGLEPLLLERGLQKIESDYEIDGMAATSPPPAGPPEIEARRVLSAEEFVAATLAQYEAFGTPPDRRRDPEQMADDFALQRLADVDVMYAAWLDGELVSAGRAEFSPRGVLMAGGATLPHARGRGAYRALVRARWDDAVMRGTPLVAVHAGAMSAPILARLGFERVVRFRRLEDVV